jgi:hypothetical protein
MRRWLRSAGSSLPKGSFLSARLALTTSDPDEVLEMMNFTQFPWDREAQ